jgi:tetratricopeptide (TPR) repeat protein
VHEPSLLLQLHGPLKVTWDGADITPPGPRARAVLAVLAVEGRALARAALAERIWGPGRLRNLRQELYNLRQLPGAESWLHLTRAEVGLRRVLIQDPGNAEPTSYLEGLSTLGTPALEDWIEEQRGAREASLARRQEHQTDRLLAALALTAPVPVPVALLAAALAQPEAHIAELLEDLPVHGGVLSERHVRPTLADLRAEHRAELLVALLREASTPELEQHLGQQLQAPDTFAVALDNAARDASWSALLHALRHFPKLQRQLFGRWMATVQRAADPAAIRECRETLDAEALRTQAPALLLEQVQHLFLEQLRAHNLADARDASDEYLRLADRHGTPDEQGRARLFRGELHRIAGQPTEADGWFNQARLVPGTSGRTTVVALNGAGAVAAVQGRLEDALRLHEEALALARESSLRAEIPRLLNSVASDAVRLGLDRRAARAYREAATLALLDGNRSVWATVLRNAALAGLRGGRPGDTRQDLHRLEGTGEVLSPIQQIMVDEVRADLARALGQPAAAREGWNRVIQEAQKLDDPARGRLARLNLAALALQEGDASALTCWRDGLAEVLADGDYMLAGECICDVLVWAAVPEAVELALKLRPTDQPANPRLALAEAIGVHRLQPGPPPPVLEVLVEQVPDTAERARAWHLLLEHHHPTAGAHHTDCLTAMSIGLSPEGAASLRDLHSQPVSLVGTG